jgi:hypothetical protein
LFGFISGYFKFIINGVVDGIPFIELRGRLRESGKRCSPLHNVQTSSEAHPVSYLMGTKFYCGVKAARE